MEGSRRDAASVSEAGGRVEAGLHAPPAAAEMRNVLGLRFWDVDLDRAARFLVDSAIAGSRTRGVFRQCPLCECGGG